MKVTEITESQEQLDEFAWLIPMAIAGARVALPWAARAGAKLLTGAGRSAAVAGRAAPGVMTGGGRLATGVGIGATGLAINDVVDMAKEDLIPLIKATFGSEAVRKVLAFAGKYSVPLLVAVAILYGGSKILKALASKSPEEAQTEAYKQQAGDYARHGGPMPKKKKRGPHPLGGKLVG